MARYTDLPFAEQIAFFRRKLHLPTARWTDIWQAAHDRAFVAAGAMQADLLADLHRAVARAIEQGTTLETFREDFDALVRKHGWTGWTGEGSPGGVAWRTRVIYETNLRTSYAAGRWAQIQAVKRDRPYLLYRHNDSVLHPRPQHQAWDGLVLAAGDPWWRTHYPPNGWGCKCRAFALSEADLEKLGKAGPDPAPPSPIDPKTGAPAGIDRGWAYAPGADAKTPLRALVDRKLFHLEAPIGAAMWARLRPVLSAEKALQWAETLDAWEKDPVPRGRRIVLGAIGPGVIRWLQDRGLPQPKGAEITLEDRLVIGRKQARHEAAQNALTQAEWRALPALLDHPGAIYYDHRDQSLVYVAEGLGPVKTVVRFMPRSGGASGPGRVVTAFRVDDVTLAGQVKGGEWEIVEMTGRRRESNPHKR